MPDDPDKTRIVQVALAEFSALRAEIQGRSTNAWTLVGINFTATAAILGFVMANHADPLILLVLPLIAPSLGMLFIDHAYNIRNLGNYINTRLRPTIEAATGSTELLRYEQEVDKYEAHRFLRFVPFGLPLTLIFTIFPLGSLAFDLPLLQPLWSRVAWAIGCLLVLIQLLLWLMLVINPKSLDPFAKK